jgi:hypothetical protein
MVPEKDRVQAFRNEVIRLVNQTENIVTFGRILEILEEKERAERRKRPETEEEFLASLDHSMEEVEKGLYYTTEEVFELIGFKKSRKRIQLKEMKTKWRQNRNPFRF